MELRREEIEAVWTGCVRIEKTGSGLVGRRFTEKQTEAFFESVPLYTGDFFNGYFGRNCAAAAGITLDFYTDAKKIELTFGGNDRPNNARQQVCDLYADRRYIRSVEAGQPVFYTPRRDGIHRVTLVFPFFNTPYLSGITLSDASAFAPVYRDGNDILFLGDSITQGVGSERPGSTMAMTVTRLLGARSLNQANSGYLYDAKTLEKVCEPRLIVLAYGHNDRHRRPEEALYEETLTYVKRVRELFPKAQVAAVLPIWCLDEQDEEKRLRLRRLDGHFRDAYHAVSGVTVLDGQSLLPHDPRFFRDGAHPNTVGHALYGGNLARALLKSRLYVPDPERFFPAPVCKTKRETFTWSL